MTRIAYTVAEFAERIGMTAVTVQRWLKSGEIPGAKVGGVWLIPVDALDARLRGYDDERARSPRGEPVQEEPGRPLGSDGDDAGRTPPVSVRRVQDSGRRRAAGAAAPARRGGTDRPAKDAPWSVPPEVAS